MPLIATTKMLIEDGDFIVLMRETFMRVVQAKKNGRPIILDRTKFYLDNIFGKPYGSHFEVDKKTSQLVHRDEDFSVQELLPEGSGGLDNRNLVSANEDNQNLGKEEIHALRKDGLTGDEVMSELIKNSSTFNQKTKFSQEKWIKKKKKRHLNIYKIVKPTTRLIADMYYRRDPSKICFLRSDSLAQILTMSNVQANSKVLLVESCQGLLAGALLSRLDSQGCLTQLFTGPNPMKGRNAFDDFGFSKALTKSRMKLFPLNELHKLSVFRAPSPAVEEVTASPAAEKVTSPAAEEVTSPAAEKGGQDVPSGEAAKRARLAEQTATASAITGSSHDSKSDELQGSCDSECRSAGDKRPASDERELPVHLVERRAAQKYIESTCFDTLIVAIKAQPTQVVLRLLSLLQLSRPFVVFHQYKEPLVELFVQLKERGGIINLRLTESWFRTIQVLPERTHPGVMMSGTSGYILTGTLVQLPPSNG